MDIDETALFEHEDELVKAESNQDDGEFNANYLIDDVENVDVDVAELNETPADDQDHLNKDERQQDPNMDDDGYSPHSSISEDDYYEVNEENLSEEDNLNAENEEADILTKESLNPIKNDQIIEANNEENGYKRESNLMDKTDIQATIMQKSVSFAEAEEIHEADFPSKALKTEEIEDELEDVNEIQEFQIMDEDQDNLEDVEIEIDEDEDEDEDENENENENGVEVNDHDQIKQEEQDNDMKKTYINKAHQENQEKIKDTFHETEDLTDKPDLTKPDISTTLKPELPQRDTMKSASDWNSLLSWARKERGPYYCFTTKMYQVDRNSKEYWSGYKPPDIPEEEKQEQNPPTIMNVIPTPNIPPSTFSEPVLGERRRGRPRKNII